MRCYFFYIYNISVVGNIRCHQRKKMFCKKWLHWLVSVFWILWTFFFSWKIAFRKNKYTLYKCNKTLRSWAWTRTRSEPGVRWSAPSCCSSRCRPWACHSASQLVLSLKCPSLSQSSTLRQHPTAWEPNADFLEGSYKVTTIWSQLTFSAPSFLCICSVGPNSLIPPYIHLCVCCSPHLTCPPAFLFPGKISSHSPRPSSDIPFPYGNASKFPRQLSDSHPDPRALSSYFV